MGWRERFGADDERARIAARARALLDAAGDRPSPVDPPSAAAGTHGAAPAAPVPSPRGGWVPPSFALPVDEPAADDRGAADVDLGAALASWREVEVEPPAPDPGRPWRDRLRVDPGRRGLVAVAAVVVVVGSVAGGVLVRGGQSSAVAVAAASGAAAPGVASAAPVVGASAPASPGGSGATAPAAASGSPSATGTVTVDVAGLVVHPGVYTLPDGSRVEDALHAAGGVRPGADLSTVNRARVLVDGEQLAVGVPGAPAATSPASAGGGSGAPAGLVDLNTADLAGLDALPGVGPVTAQKILDWRTEHGRFASVDDLQNVSGIGPTRFADLKDLVTV